VPTPVRVPEGVLEVVPEGVLEVVLKVVPAGRALKGRLWVGGVKA